MPLLQYAPRPLFLRSGPVVGLDLGDLASDAADAAGDVAGVKKPWGPYGSEAAAIFESNRVIQKVWPDANPAQRQMALAIGWAESRFGVTPDWQFPDGTPSYNWGAVTSVGGQKSLPHADHDAAGNPITQGFAAYGSAEGGFSAFLNVWGKLAGSAAATGDAVLVAAIMYDRHYYTGTSGDRTARVRAYAGMIGGGAAKVAAALGESNAVWTNRKDVPAPAGGTGGGSPAPGGGGAPALEAVPDTSDTKTGLIIGSVLGLGVFGLWLAKG